MPAWHQRYLVLLVLLLPVWTAEGAAAAQLRGQIAAVPPAQGRRFQCRMACRQAAASWLGLKRQAEAGKAWVAAGRAWQGWQPSKQVTR